MPALYCKRDTIKPTTFLVCGLLDRGATEEVGRQQPVCIRLRNVAGRISRIHAGGRPQTTRFLNVCSFSSGSQHVCKSINRSRCPPSNHSHTNTRSPADHEHPHPPYQTSPKREHQLESTAPAVTLRHRHTPQLHRHLLHPNIRVRLLVTDAMPPLIRVPTGPHALLPHGPSERHPTRRRAGRQTFGLLVTSPATGKSTERHSGPVAVVARSASSRQRDSRTGPVNPVRCCRTVVVVGKHRVATTRCVTNATWREGRNEGLLPKRG